MHKTIGQKIYEFMNGEEKTISQIAEAFPEISRSSISGRLHENLGKKFERIGVGKFRPLTLEEIEQIQKQKVKIEKPVEEVKEPVKVEANNRELVESLKLMRAVIDDTIRKLEV